MESGEVWVGVWESIWGEWGSVLACGKGCGERNEEGVGKCVRLWGPNTLPHISFLTFPYISSYLPHTPTHFPTPPLIPVPLPTSPLHPPTPQHIFLQSPHLPHLLKVWRSFHVTKFLWRRYRGEVTMWRSYWQPIRVVLAWFTVLVLRVYTGYTVTE